MNIITASVIKSTLRFTPRIHSKSNHLPLNESKNQILNDSSLSDEKSESKISVCSSETIEKIQKKNKIQLEKCDEIDVVDAEDVYGSSECSKSDVLGSKMTYNELIVKCEKESLKIHEHEEKGIQDKCTLSINEGSLKIDSDLDYSKILEDKESSEHQVDCMSTFDSVDQTLKKWKPKMVELNQCIQQNVKKFKKSKRKRSVSPVNSEQLTIEPTEIKISDLCKDIRIGRKSLRFNEIRKMEAIKKKIPSKNSGFTMENSYNEDLCVEVKDALFDDKNSQRTCTSIHNPKPLLLKSENTNVAKYHLKGAPQVRVVNGKIVIDESSLQIDRRERDVNPNIEMELVEENDLSRKVNSASWGKREKSDRWSKEETQKFYNALSQWGTDFGVICKMFPNRSQRQIKNKFNSEEKKYPEKIDIALKSRKPIDIAAYSKATGSNFRSIDEIENELKKVREDFQESRRISIENAKILLNKNMI